MTKIVPRPRGKGKGGRGGRWPDTTAVDADVGDADTDDLSRKGRRRPHMVGKKFLTLGKRHKPT
jgi:hypothetical protein